MSSTRSGCAYCFKTLDPQDKGKELQTFVECRNCHTLYHTVCYTQIGKCVTCGGTEVVPIKVPSPFPLLSIIKKEVTPITPSALTLSTGTSGFVVPDIVYKELMPTIQNSEIFRTISNHVPPQFKNPDMMLLAMMVLPIVMCSFCCLVNFIISAFS